ncbi:MAG: fluoride efflux transporter CrcB [Proteobacteria bacterium]|nr:fluoride efflux transporter CrcB [Pseudomonadota bacterium]
MKWLLIAFGGGLGAVLRFSLALWVDQRVPLSFPWGTFAVNGLGCLAIGVVATVADAHTQFPAGWRLFLITGVLGGFTTFSTFGLETWRLVENGALAAAAINAFGSVAVGLVAVVCGILLTRPWV